MEDTVKITDDSILSGKIRNDSSKIELPMVRVNLA